MSSTIRVRGAVIAAIASLALALTACAGAEPPAGLGQGVELEGVTATLVDVSGGPAYVEWEITGTEGGACRPASMTIVPGAGALAGTPATLTMATDFSCVVVGAGEVGALRMLAEGDLHVGDVVEWADADGDQIASWILP